MRRLNAIVLAMAVLLGLAGPARAANPRITLRLDGATASQAVTAVSIAAAVNLELMGIPRFATEKASFDWEDARLSSALRDLAAMYHLVLQNEGGRYVFYPAGGPQPPAGRGRVLFQGREAELTLNRLWVTHYVVADLTGEGSDESRSLGMDLFCTLPDGDAGAIEGFANVSAQDDVGNVLTAPGILFGNPVPQPYPDQWRSDLALKLPDGRARKLAWVEGDVIGFRKYAVRRIELKSEEAGPGFTPRADDDFRVETFTLEPDRTLGVPGSMRLKARISLPFTSDLRSGPYPFREPMVVSESGAILPSSNQSGTYRNGPDRRVYSLEETFTPGADKVARFIFTCEVTGDLGPLFSFRAENIAFPGPVPALASGAFPRSELRGDSGSPTTAPEPAFFAETGGGLTSFIRVLDQPPPVGYLSVGLSAQEDGKWTPVRWRHVAVDRDGRVTLTNVKPGTYRIYRAYRPNWPLHLPSEGRWSGVEVVANVVSGAAIDLPELVWKPDTPGTDASSPAR